MYLSIYEGNVHQLGKIIKNRQTPTHHQPGKPLHPQKTAHSSARIP